MHHTVNETPNIEVEKYNWQKKHEANLTGTSKAYKPSKITKNIKKKYETWKN
tara:strand:- start:303 stop:458 length:156 start_codon:yes stop_codon:yes gene_type:complete